MESRPNPKSIKVFGILHLIFGTFGLAIAPANFANLLTNFSGNRFPNHIPMLPAIACNYIVVALVIA